MIIQCPSCKSRFSIDAEKITSPASKGRCSVCGHVFPLLQHAVEDLEVAMLRDRFEKEKAERARSILDYHGGVYGMPKEKKKPEVPLQEETVAEGEIPSVLDVSDDQETFPSLEEELDAMEAFPADSLAGGETESAPQGKADVQSPPSPSEDETDEWAEAAFSIPDVDEEPEPAGWEEELAKDIEENLRPDTSAVGGLDSDSEPVFSIDSGQDLDLQAETVETKPKPRPRGPLPKEALHEHQGDARTFQPERPKLGGHPWKGEEEEDSEVSIDEALPQEKGSRRSLLSRLILIVILFILIVAGGGWYLYETGTLTSQKSFTGRIIEKINAIRGKSSMVLYNLRNEQEPARDGKFFTVRGMVQNKGEGAVPFVPLRIKIFDGQGRLILTGKTVAGKVLSPENISKMTVQNVLKTYHAQNQRNRQTLGELSPGGKLPFLFLFDLSKFPRKTAKTFQVEILEAAR